MSVPSSDPKAHNRAYPPDDLARPVDTGRGAGTASTTPDHPSDRSRFRLKVRSILVLVVLLPLIATGILTGMAAYTQWNNRQGARAAALDAQQLERVAFARAKVNDIRVPAMAVSFAAQIGVDETELGQLLHLNFPNYLKTGKASIQSDPVFVSTPRLRADTNELYSILPKIPIDAISFNDVKTFMTKYAQDIDNLWYADFAKLQDNIKTWQPPGSFSIHLDALRQTYVAFLNGGNEIEGAIYVNEGEEGAPAKLELIQAAGTFASAASEFQNNLGPLGNKAWQELKASQASKSFNFTIAQGIYTALYGGQPAFASNVSLAGQAMRNGLTYLDKLSSLVRSASLDLFNVANSQAASASNQFISEVVLLFVLLVISIGGIIFAGRTLTKPLKGLSDAAQRVHSGEFNLEKLAETGPQEVALTTIAFNEMTSTLKAVETTTMALAAEDISHPDLQVPLPGKTGEALQATVDHLASVIRERELQRKQLHEAATHDRLTGLLNRAAVLDYLDHDVSRRRNQGETVAVLFVDLDGLKPFNDTYGHEAGDAAIKATANALVEATGDCDVIGRLGGDEFLLVLCADHSAQSQEVSDRISKAVSSRSIVARDKTISLSASIGVALTQCGAETDPMELVKQADEAMYEAKRAARMTRDQMLEASSQTKASKA